jgi:hypothetical protein
VGVAVSIFRRKKMEPRIGRIVDYQLSAEDVKQIDEMRAPRIDFGRRMNPHSVGQIVPFVIVVVWPNEYGPEYHGVNGQALLDGNESLWVTSAKCGTEPGTWSWPA